MLIRLRNTTPASIAAVTGALLFLGACATPTTKLDPGASLPADQLAILTVKFAGVFGAQPLLRSLDGKTIEQSRWDGSAKVEMAPGPHRLAVGFVQVGIGGNSFSRQDEVVEFDAAAGRIYELRVTTSREGSFLFGGERWDAKVVDVTSDAAETNR